MKQQITTPIVQKQITSLQAYFKKYAINQNIDTETDKKLAQYTKILHDKKNHIAVVANMSAGKSTFVNALFGTHVLPTSTKATTDCPTYIHSYENTAKKAKIFFQDNKEPVILQENELKDLEEYAKKDEDCKDERFHKVEKIDLYYPFKNLNTNQEFEIILIDTPGPNSTGNGYAEKHRTTTRQVLRETNAALFLFDYGQLDANLVSDEQGLWNTIQEKVKIDKNFQLFIVLNKIDAALDDYSTQLQGLSEEEQFAKMRELWGSEEQKAINKLINAAKEHGIENPKIFAVSAGKAYHQRSYHALSRSEQRAYKGFEASFEDIWEENSESKLIDYLGMEKLENAIMDLFIQTNQNILQYLANELQNLIYEEQYFLASQLKELDNINCGQDIQNKLAYLNNEVPKLQKEMQEKTNIIKEDSKKELQEIFNHAMKEHFHDKIKYLTSFGIIFLNEYAEGKKQKAAKNAIDMLSEQGHNDAKKLEKRVTIALNEGITYEEAYDAMQNALKEELIKYRENFHDLQIQMKGLYAQINENNHHILKEYKAILQHALGSENDLHIQQTNIKTKIDFSVFLNPDMDYLSGSIKYQDQKEETITVSASTWYMPWTWFDTKTETKMVDAHEIEIDPKQLQEDIQASIKGNIDKICNDAIKQHENNIIQICNDHVTLFDDFKALQIHQIEALKTQLQNKEESKRQMGVRQKELEQISTLGF